jgi:hypothetical protein
MEITTAHPETESTRHHQSRETAMDEEPISRAEIIAEAQARYDTAIETLRKLAINEANRNKFQEATRGAQDAADHLADVKGDTSGNPRVAAAQVAADIWITAEPMRRV